jgi:hypothetical protein
MTGLVAKLKRAVESAIEANDFTQLLSRQQRFIM